MLAVDGAASDMVRDGSALRLLGAHGDIPFHSRGVRLPDCTLITGFRKHHNFLTVQQAMALRDIADICNIPGDAVCQA